MPKDRGNDRHIGHVAHTSIGIIDDEHITWTERALPLADHTGHDLKKDGELEWGSVAGANQSSMTITNCRGEIANLDHG